MEWSTTRASAVRWGLIALLALCALAWLRFAPPSHPWSPQGIIGRIMPPPRVVEKIRTVEVPGPERIRIIPKEKIVEVYRDLPTPATVADNAAVVTAVAAIPPAPEGGTAVSVLRTGPDNVATGHIEFKPKPIAFFAVKREMGIRAGFGTEGITGELYVRPLRIGPVEIEGRVYGASGQDGKSNVGAAVMADWRF